VELGKLHVVPFNIFIDARYHQMKIVGDETCMSVVCGYLILLVMLE
jgi:hypothetical protein